MSPESVQSFISVVEWVDQHRQEAGDIHVEMKRAERAQSIIREPRVLVIGKSETGLIWNSLGCTCTAFHTEHFDTVDIKDYAQRGVSAILETMNSAKAQDKPYDILFLHEKFDYDADGKTVAEQFPECRPMLCLAYTRDQNLVNELMHRRNVIVGRSMIDNPVLDMVLALNFGKEGLRNLSREPIPGARHSLKSEAGQSPPLDQPIL